MNKPKLIIIEGPAGTGKTTIQNFLQNALKANKINVDILPEFSNNNLGRLIKDNCEYGNDKPNWLMGISGLLLFLADKIIEIETAKMDAEKLWICDRFISTQFILGLKNIGRIEDKLFAEETIQKVFDWSLKNISEHSIFVFLESNFDILQERLEKRIDRKLTLQELKYLDDEISGYCQLAILVKAKNIFIVGNNSSLEKAGNKILKHIYSKWHQ